MFLCCGLCNIREIVFHKCKLQLHKQLIYIRQAAKCACRSFFYNLFCQDRHNCEKFYEKTRVFLTGFESLSKVARFHKISEKLLFVLAIHVMLILGKLRILYFPRPLKCCTYELLSIRENRIEKTQDTGPRTTTTVALF